MAEVVVRLGAPIDVVAPGRDAHMVKGWMVRIDARIHDAHHDALACEPVLLQVVQLGEPVRPLRALDAEAAGLRHRHDEDRRDEGERDRGAAGRGAGGRGWHGTTLDWRDP